MSKTWTQTNSVPGPPRPGPVTKVKRPLLRLAAIRFQNTVALYKNSNTHALAKGDLQWLAKGERIAEPEWMASRKENYPAAFLRKSKLTFEATFLWPAKTAATGMLVVSPALDGNLTALTTVGVPFSIKADDPEPKVLVELSSLPDEVGRYTLELSWEAQSRGGPSDFEFPKTKTEHSLFCIYGAPYTAADDSPDKAFTGAPAGGLDTLTGTRRRLDKLMSLLGPSRRLSMAAPDQLRELIWLIHVGISDHQNPPYFDPIHDEFITVNGDCSAQWKDDVLPGGGGAVVGSPQIPLEDQWLMWVTTAAPHWNTASCIGYVQLLKTAAAAIGVFTRRAWVFPRTLVLPGGKSVAFKDDDLWCVGKEDASKYQKVEVVNGKGRKTEATLCLMDPSLGFERFEGCAYTPNKHFLPGAYSTTGIEKGAPGFVANRGFSSAQDVLRWWCNTKRGSFQRFMCWVDLKTVVKDKPQDVWDRDGRYYPASQYEQIRETGKQVPVP